MACLLLTICTLCIFTWATWCTTCFQGTLLPLPVLPYSSGAYTQAFTSHTAFSEGLVTAFSLQNQTLSSLRKHLTLHIIALFTLKSGLTGTTLFWSEDALSLCYPVGMGTSIKGVGDLCLLKLKEFCNIAKQAKSSPHNFFLSIEEIPPLHSAKAEALQVTNDVTCGLKHQNGIFDHQKTMPSLARLIPVSCLQDNSLSSIPATH